VITIGAYPVFVPATDADGNDLAGIHLPEVAAPLATYSGWNVRAAAFAGDDMCNATGQRIDFAQTQAARLASGDPRLSVAERYPSHQAYVDAVTQAANDLLSRRFLLPEDVQAYITTAAASNVALDTTAPTVTVAADITSEATGPAGAAVTFAATATDNWDLDPSVVCSPASGTTFAIGTTVVTCTAIDATGNTASGKFSVRVKGASEQLADLASAVTSVGAGTSLYDKVSDARAALASSDVVGACSILRALLNELSAQSGKHILPATANALIADVTRIRAVLAC